MRLNNSMRVDKWTLTLQQRIFVFLKVTMSIWLIISLRQLWLGSANIFTALLIYGYTFYGIWLILRYKYKNAFNENRTLLFWAVCVSTITLEIGLRYATTQYHSYPEKNGALNYVCPFAKIRAENLARSTIQDDVGVYTGPITMSRIESKREFAFEHRYNSFGLRDKEPNQAQLDSSFVVVGLGDSFTEGAGAPADSSWIKLLSAQLSTCNPRILTVNAGISGSDIVYEAYKLKKLIQPNYKPALAIFAINTSDITDVVIRGGFERFVSKNQVAYRQGPWWKYLYSFSFIWRAIAHEFLGVDWSLYSNDNRALLEEDAKEIMYATIVDEIIPFAKNNNIQTLFVFTPMEYEIGNEHFALTDLSKKLAKRGVNVLNLNEDFSKYSKENVDYYWDIDMHCNSQGYLLWSKAIADNIRKQGLTDCD